MSDAGWEYAYFLDSGQDSTSDADRLVGVGPTTNLDSVESDRHAWERDGFTGRIMRRPVARWEDMPSSPPARRLPGRQVKPCPECVQGKHPNCDGTAWDDVADGPTVCPCAHNLHRPLIHPGGSPPGSVTA